MDKIKHGLDLPNEDAEKIRDYLMKKYNVTEEDLETEDDEENEVEESKESRKSKYETKLKEYYSPSDVDKLTEEELKNPEVMKRVRASMTKWK